MTNKFNIERLEGRGITAKVVKTDQVYTTYKDFAIASGYPEASADSLRNEKGKNASLLNGKNVSILAKGKHERGSAIIYVVQEGITGEYFLFGEKGLDIIETKMPETTYVEIAEPFGKQVREMIQKAYAEGYKQGKFDAQAEANVEDVPKESAQQKRDRIVEQAKKDVEGLHDDGFIRKDYGVRRLEFLINREKRTVVALLRGFIGGKVFEKGIAKCAPDDCFNSAIGRAIALSRALGLEVPAEYMNAPRPTEVRVGDKVKYYRATEGWIIREITNSNAEAMYDTEKAHIESRVAKEGIVIDDSRDGGESQ